VEIKAMKKKLMCDCLVISSEQQIFFTLGKKSFLVNQSLTTGIFPQDLKIAKIRPVYKKNDDTLLDNYRPISILPSISKVFEKVIHSQINEHFKSN